MRSVGVDVECAVAERLPSGPVDGFGASDCGCPSHLAVVAQSDAEEGGRDRAALDALTERVLAAHEAAVASSGDPDATVEVVAGSEE